jgi:hypothetical protein
MPLNMLQIAQGSRKLPRPGDIFVFQMRVDRLFRFGRVIRTDVKVKSITANLLYIYGRTSTTKLPVPGLFTNELLLPPLLINNTGWREGFFETVEHQRLEPRDVLSVHCFFEPIYRQFVDADENQLPQRYEPCGLHAVGGYGGVDWDVSKALGFPEPTEDSSDSLVGNHHSGPKRKGRKRRQSEQLVTICVTGKGVRPLASAFEQLEERLIDAISESGVGEWEGHELALDGRQALIFLRCSSADRLAEVILPIVRQAALPQGSYLLKRYGGPGDTEERVAL